MKLSTTEESKTGVVGDASLNALDAGRDRDGAFLLEAPVEVQGSPHGEAVVTAG